MSRRNLDANLEAICRQAEFDQITAETEAPLGVAVGLIVRQHLTGRPLPPAAEHVAQFWRDYVEANAGQDIEALKTSIHDQHDFAVRCQNILRDLGLSTDLEDPPELQQNDSDVDTLEDENEPETEYAPEDVVLDEDSYGDEDSEGETSTVEMDADMDMSELGAESEPEEAPQSAIDDLGSNSNDHRLQKLYRRIRRGRKGRRTLRCRGVVAVAWHARSATGTSQAYDCQTGESPSTQTASQAEPDLGIRS